MEDGPDKAILRGKKEGLPGILDADRHDVNTFCQFNQYTLRQDEPTQCLPVLHWQDSLISERGTKL
jgi:hypothetical protein